MLNFTRYKNHAHRYAWTQPLQLFEAKVMKGDEINISFRNFAVASQEASAHLFWEISITWKMRKLFNLSATFLAIATFMSCAAHHSTAIATQFTTDECGVITKFNTGQPAVFLVFTAHFSTSDNGYFENFDGIEPVLNTLKEKGVKGSFFPTGYCFVQEKYKKSIKRIIKEGHYLSHHSFHHLLLCENGKSLVTADSLDRDFQLMERQLSLLGLKKNQYDWIIPPYETYDLASATEMKRLGYTLINPTPSIRTDMDWTSPGTEAYLSSEQILDNLWKYEQEHTLNGVVLLIHAMNYPDRSDNDRIYTHLGEIIDKLRAKGYKFKTIFDVK